MSLTTMTSGNFLVPQTIDDAMRQAEMMARARLVPKHLQGSPGDCFMVVEQARRWGMSPFAVAQATSVIQGKLMYEGKLVAAAVHTSGATSTRFRYDFSGEGDNRTVRVSAVLAGETEPRSVDVRLGDVRTNNDIWRKQPDQQLTYAGVRIWARRYTPEVILGVYAPEEMEPAPVVAVHHGPTIEASAEVVREAPAKDKATLGAEALAARFAEVVDAGQYYAILDEPKVATQMQWLKANRPDLFDTVDTARRAAAERMADTPAPAEGDAVGVGGEDVA